MLFGDKPRRLEDNFAGDSVPEVTEEKGDVKTKNVRVDNVNDIFELFPSERKWSLQGENDISVCPLTADLAGCTLVHMP